jgi:hypothetical protein
MSKIVSFGDSFIFGSELQNNFNGAKAWPGLIAHELGMDFFTCAEPGCGNENIAQQIFNYFSSNKDVDCVAIINWTWMCRWDFFLNLPVEIPITQSSISKQSLEETYDIIKGVDWPSFDDFNAGKLTSNIVLNQEILNSIKNLKIVLEGKWMTLGPTCVPSKLNWLNQTESKNLIDWYNKYLNNNVLYNKFKSLQAILSVQHYLETKKIKNIQTYMDYELFDNTYENLSPPFIVEMQNQLKDKLNLFHHNKNFLDWAKDLNFKITPSPGDHPLEEAHFAAADLYLDRIKKYTQ